MVPQCDNYKKTEQRVTSAMISCPPPYQLQIGGGGGGRGQIVYRGF